MILIRNGIKLFAVFVCFASCLSCHQPSKQQFVVNGDDAEVISEEEAKKIVEGKGGKNFDNLEDVLYKVDEDGLYSGID